jgi:methionyl aminopeptidase
MTTLFDPEAQAQAGELTRDLLELLAQTAQPGVSTFELEDTARDFFRITGSEPSFLGFGAPPYPAVLQTALNHEVLHSLPDSRVFLQSGDVLTIATGISIDHTHAFGMITVPIGKVESHLLQLIHDCERACMAGIEAVEAGATTGDVANAIWNEAQDHSIILDLVGGGIGRRLHMPPDIDLRFDAYPGSTLHEGQALRVLVLMTDGGPEWEYADDNWAIVTKDRSIAVGFGHTVQVLDGGFRLITA